MRQFAMRRSERGISLDLCDEGIFLHCLYFAFLCFLFVDLVWIVVPNMDFVVYEIFDIRLSREKPVELMQDAGPVHFFSGEKRESFSQIVTHLITKETVGRYTSAFINLFIT